jgi:hypothetical protein
MRKSGLTGLTISAGCVALLFVLSEFGLVRFGPCGPDPLGLVFLLGFLLFGGLGILLIIAGLLSKGTRKLHGSGPDLRKDQPNDQLQ